MVQYILNTLTSTNLPSTSTGTTALTGNGSRTVTASTGYGTGGSGGSTYNASTGTAARTSAGGNGMPGAIFIIEYRTFT